MLDFVRGVGGFLRQGLCVALEPTLEHALYTRLALNSPASAS